jgi:hypothetical protein
MSADGRSWNLLYSVLHVALVGVRGSNWQLGSSEINPPPDTKLPKKWNYPAKFGSTKVIVKVGVYLEWSPFHTVIC